MIERISSGFHPFVIPFVFGVVYILTWCLFGLIRIIRRLPLEDKLKFFKSLLIPKTVWKNIKDIFCDCLFHVKLWKRNKLLGYMHSSIAFGWFMLIVLGHIEVMLYTPHRVKFFYYPIFFRFFVAKEGDISLLGGPFFFLMDLFLLIVLSGSVLAISKRFTSIIFGMRRTTRHRVRDNLAMVCLWAIFPLRLVAEGFTAGISGGSFLTQPLNKIMGAFMSNEANMLPSWWAYSIVLCLFFVLLPFTRYMHIPTEILLIPLKNAGLKIKHARRGLTEAYVYSCPSCGVCIDACPMNIDKAGRKTVTVYLNRQLRWGNMKGAVEIADKCLLCGKCSALCPIDLPGDKLRIAQRNAVKYGLTPDYSTINTSEAFAEHKEWAADSGKVLYFAGCMTQLLPAISKSMISLMNKAGVEYSWMDSDGGLCCGRPLLMAGRRDAAKELIEKNTEYILGSGADTLVLSCPICCRVFRENYNLPGIRVLHHSEFLLELIKSGALKPAKSDISYAYHDPCELGRGLGVYKAPRKVIESAAILKEGAKHHEESICCGGSIGSISLGYNKRMKIAENSLENLCADNPDAIATACPLCQSTFLHTADRPVHDLAEIIDSQTV